MQPSPTQCSAAVYAFNHVATLYARALHLLDAAVVALLHRQYRHYYITMLWLSATDSVGL